MTTLSGQLAEWVSRPLKDCPGDVIEKTKLHILDIVGVMLAACTLDTVAAAKRAAMEEEGDGSAPILGHAERVSLPTAAFVNGVMSAVLEFDDTHIQSNIHPTGFCAAVAIPECHRRGLSGMALIESILVGSELACRAGLVAPVRMHELGFHPTAVYGVFGAVYALAKARHLAPSVIVDAIGTAASLSSGLISSFEDGTSTKTLHVGFAAASAVRAVAMASQGISGPATVFEGRFGWYRSFVQSPVEFRFNALTDKLGADWEILNVQSKSFPCAYTMMPFIAATLALRERHQIKPEQVARIACDILPRSIPIVCEPRLDKIRPKSTWHGRISLQHTVAEALVEGRMDKGAYAEACLRNPVINAIADTVEYVADPAAGADKTRSGGKVTIWLKDGTELSHTIHDMPGTRRNPHGRDDYIAKFKSNTRDALSPGHADEVIDALLSLDRLSNVAPLFNKLSIDMDQRCH
jgi:2-methylcitrate dehydratase PrpD